MKKLLWISLIALTLTSCNSKKSSKSVENKKYNIENVDCIQLQNESIDSTFTINGISYNLKCNVECFDKYSIIDTIDETTIRNYQDRLFRFSLKSDSLDTQFIVTKDLFKDSYEDNLTFKKSVLGIPQIKLIDSTSNSILIKSVFAYAHAISGTDYFEEIDFYISTEGKVSFKEIIPFHGNGD